MPVQINEVIIKTVVDPRPSGSGGPSNPVECPPGTSTTQDELLEKVLQIINEKTER